jgi:diaminopimelate epimerase
VPRFAPAQIPFNAPQQQPRYVLRVNEQKYTVGVVSMGNPHVVLLVDDVERAPVAELGALLEHHPAFPQRVNTGFLQIINRQQLKLRVFERGTGETMACGTGACAAAVIARLWGLSDETIHIQLKGGDLTIQWTGEGEPVWMTGAAVAVFDGWIDLEQFK